MPIAILQIHPTQEDGDDRPRPPGQYKAYPVRCRLLRDPPPTRRVAYHRVIVSPCLPPLLSVKDSLRAKSTRCWAPAGIRSNSRGVRPWAVTFVTPTHCEVDWLMPVIQLFSPMPTEIYSFVGQMLASHIPFLNVQTLGMRIMIGFSFLKPKTVVSRSNFRVRERRSRARLSRLVSSGMSQPTHFPRVPDRPRWSARRHPSPLSSHKRQARTTWPDASSFLHLGAL